jgi:ribonucleoside-triphosphate reductase
MQPITRNAWYRHPALVLAALTAPPALLCTLLVWAFLAHWWQLSLFFWYSIPGNSFVLLPHDPAVVYAGTLYPALLVAVVGGAATAIASAVDYWLIRRAFHSKTVGKVKETRLFRWAVRWFRWQPFLTIIVFALTPIPFYPIRVLAPAADYPAWRYVAAVVVGRIPRYYLIALGGAWASRVTWGWFG